MLRGWRVPIACALGCAALAAGCGNEGVPTSNAPKATAETRDKPPPPPRDWRRVVNVRAGFSVGIPPGWTAKGATDTTLIRSRDRALVVAISADRSDGGREASPEAYAERIATSLPGYRGLLTGKTERVRTARYPTASVTASGSLARTGVRQAITIFAVSRPHRVMYTIAVSRSASTPASRYAPYLERLVRSFTAAPPQY